MKKEARKQDRIEATQIRVLRKWLFPAGNYTKTAEEPMIRSYEDLIVYQLAYSLAMRIYKTTSTFPREEVYSLTDQVRRSSRSVPVNLAEGWAKRHFENVFRKHLIDAIGSCDETKVWLQIAHDCGYLPSPIHQELLSGYKGVGRMLHSLLNTWRKFEK